MDWILIVFLSLFPQVGDRIEALPVLVSGGHDTIELGSDLEGGVNDLLVSCPRTRFLSSRPASCVPLGWTEWPLGA